MTRNLPIFQMWKFRLYSSTQDIPSKLIITKYIEVTPNTDFPTKQIYFYNSSYGPHKILKNKHLMIDMIFLKLTNFNPFTIYS